MYSTKTLELSPNKKISMKNITINLPPIYDEKIWEFVKKGTLPSRSEAIRQAIREFLHNEYKNIKLLGYFS